MIGDAIRFPSTATKMPAARANAMEVRTALFAFSGSRAPMFWAISTFAPTDIPTKKLTSRETIGVLLPTAAIASMLANLPTTATSVALKSCCSMLVSMSGMAKRRTLSTIEPLVRSGSEGIRFFRRRLSISITF